MGLGEGGRKRAAAMQSLVGLPSYKNLREALEGLLARHLATKCKQEIQTICEEQAPKWQPKQAVNISPALLRLQQSRREERLAHYEQVIALRKLGLSQAAIARQVGIGASTVQSWLEASRFPERKPREQASHVDRYLPYLVQRWEKGCHNIAGLFQELVAQGYQVPSPMNCWRARTCRSACGSTPSRRRAMASIFLRGTSAVSSPRR